jgi:hypothetical protein
MAAGQIMGSQPPPTIPPAGTNPPPPIVSPMAPPPKPGKSIYHQAALASILAPFISIVLNMMIESSRGGRVPSRQEVLCDAIFIMLIIFMGFVCGIVALCGIRKHGTAGLLWRPIIGMSIFILLFLLAIPNFLYARKKALERREQQRLHQQQEQPAPP